MKKITTSITIVFCMIFSLNALSLDEKFINACAEGNYIVATELLEQGANIEARDGCDHQTALVFSANRGHEKIVKMLIENGAEINAQDDKGWTALSEAAYRGHADIVELLLKNKASTLPSTSWIDSREYGNAVFWTIESSHNSYTEKVKIVKLLLDYNAEPEGTDNQNRNSLEIAKIRNYSEIVEFLERYNKERIAKQNEYALLEAMRNQDIRNIKFYLEKKVNPNSLLPNGESILNYAVHTQNFSIVKLLLEYGANPNTQNELGISATMATVRYNNEQILNLLIHYGTNLNQRDKKGRNALFYAIENNNTSILKTLLQSGINKNATDIYGANAFLYACSLGNIPACRILIQNNCSTSSSDLYGTTALHIAAQKGMLSLVKLILSNCDIDVNAKDSNGNTALYYAQKNKNHEIIEILEQEIEDF